MGMAFVAVSLAFLSFTVNWSARGNSILNAWDEMAGLFAFGYHPVSATEWAAMGNAAEPICPESDLPGRQLFATVRPAEARSKQMCKTLTAKIIPVRQRVRRQEAPAVIAATIIESDESAVDDVKAEDEETLPVYTIDFAEIAGYEPSFEVEEFTARANEIAQCEIDLINTLRVRAYAISASRFVKLAPVVVKSSGWIELILKTRLRKDATPAPVTCGP
jgi:hypothetical protein